MYVCKYVSVLSSIAILTARSKCRFCEGVKTTVSGRKGLRERKCVCVVVRSLRRSLTCARSAMTNTTMAMPPPPPKNPNPSSSSSSESVAETAAIAAAAAPPTTSTDSATAMAPPPPRIPEPSSSSSSNSHDSAEPSPPPPPKPSSSSQGIAVPYKIPPWSGAPCHEFYLEVLKDGSIIDKYDVSVSLSLFFSHSILFETVRVTAVSYYG